MELQKLWELNHVDLFLAGHWRIRLNAGFVPIRKPGKLPAETISQSYELEYGFDTIEIHADALNPEDVVLIHDDLACYRRNHECRH